MRTYLTLALVAVAHAALSLGLLSVATAGAMARIDTGADPSVGERVLGAATRVLWLPLAGPVTERGAELADGWIVLLVLMNSLIWAAALVFGARALRRKRRG